MASTFGCSLWHNICPKYRKHLLVTRQQFGLLDGPRGQLSAEFDDLKRDMKGLVEGLVGRGICEVELRSDRGF